MAYRDLVKQAATVNGTGAFTLGAAVSGFQTMNAGRAVGETVDYAFRLGTDWEVGVGTIAAGGTLARAPSASSNGGSLVNFAAGTGEIVETVTAASLNAFASVRDIPFATAIPLTRPGSAYMADKTVNGPLTFTAAAGAVRGAMVYLRMIADGVNMPNFSAFKQWGLGGDYDNRNGIVNQVQFFYDGADLFYSASQAVGAVAVAPAAAGVTMTGPTGGVNGVASSNFTLGVTPVGGTISGTVRITPASTVPGDTFTPSFRDVTTAAPTGTFTLTPSSTGARTISATNNGGLANPAGITYTATATAPAGGYLRLATLDAGTAESGTGPYTYTVSNGGASFGTKGGVSSQLRPTGADASAIVINSNNQGMVYGVTTAANSAFTAMDYGILAGNATNDAYTPIVAGGVGSPTAVLVAAGDSIRLSFIGSTLVVEVARSASPTTWIAVYTFTGVSTAARKFAVNAQFNGSFVTSTATGLSEASQTSESTGGTAVRLSPRSSDMTESATAPWVYTGTGGIYSADFGGTATQALQSGVDGSLSQKFTGTPNAEIMLGIKPMSTVKAFDNFVCAFYTEKTSGKYKPFTSGAAQNATNAVAVANGDIMRLRRTGSSVIGEVSKDNGSTWTTIYTWTGVSTGVMYFQSCIGTAAGTVSELVGVGLA